jgi:hypothetical protein
MHFSFCTPSQLLQLASDFLNSGVRGDRSSSLGWKKSRLLDQLAGAISEGEMH